jgi:tetratricopeptide (TPR) repeat protein
MDDLAPQASVPLSPGFVPVTLKLRPHRPGNFGLLALSLAGAALFAYVAFTNGLGLKFVGIVFPWWAATAFYAALALLSAAWVVWFVWTAVRIVIHDAKVVLLDSEMKITAPERQGGFRRIWYCLIVEAQELKSEDADGCSLRLTLLGGEVIELSRMWFADADYAALIATIAERCNRPPTAPSGEAAGPSSARLPSLPGAVTAVTAVHVRPPASAVVASSPGAPASAEQGKVAEGVLPLFPPEPPNPHYPFYGAAPGAAVAAALSYFGAPFTALIVIQALLCLIGASVGALWAWNGAVGKAGGSRWGDLGAAVRAWRAARWGWFGLSWLLAVVVPPLCLSWFHSADQDRARGLSERLEQARRYRDQREYARAAAEYSEALKLADPKRRPREAAALYRARGMMHLLSDHLDLALADSNEAIRLGAGEADSFELRGSCFARKGDLGRALADFDEAIRLDPRLATAYLQRGRVHERRSDFGSAARDRATAARLDPRLSGQR